MKHVLVAGRGFIGKAIAAHLGKDAHLADHGSAAGLDLAPFAAVIWAGRHPALGKPEWRLSSDSEPFMARRAAEAGLRFLTLSTRKVYAASPEPLGEDAPLGPSDAYGRQKLAIEEALLAIPGLDLVRLRLSNIFGFERGRRTFAGFMLDGLASRGEITFDMNPAVARDFLPVTDAALATAAIARLPAGALPPDRAINLGSGVALACGDLARAVIEGYGSGRLVVTDQAMRDPFTLSIARLQALVPGFAVNRDHLLAYAKALGQRLATAS